MSSGNERNLYGQNKLYFILRLVPDQGHKDHIGQIHGTSWKLQCFKVCIIYCTSRSKRLKRLDRSGFEKSKLLLQFSYVRIFPKFFTFLTLSGRTNCVAIIYSKI